MSFDKFGNKLPEAWIRSSWKALLAYVFLDGCCCVNLLRSAGTGKRSQKLSKSRLGPETIKIVILTDMDGVTYRRDIVMVMEWAMSAQ